MPLPPSPTQIADQVKLNRKDTPDLKKRPAPMKVVEVDSLINEITAVPSETAEWAEEAPADLSAAEVALERIKADHRARQGDKKALLEPKAKRITRTGPPSLFVLDTNVLMHDPASLFRFAEHDLYLPMTTLEELDNHKKGMSEVARNARTVSRSLDQLIAGTSGTLDDGIPLNKLGHQDVSGKLYFQTHLTTATLPEGLPEGKGDNLILAVVSELQQKHADKEVVLVSKDINMRIKARALGLPAEDYFNDQVLEDRDLMYSGVMTLPSDFWPKHGKSMESWADSKSGPDTR
jgi:PhoH-like ATPase